MKNCGICKIDGKTPIRCNNVDVCFGCLKFISNRAVKNHISSFEQLRLDTAYQSR